MNLEIHLANSCEENSCRGIGTRRAHKHEVQPLRSRVHQLSFLLFHTWVSYKFLTEESEDADGGGVVATQPSISPAKKSVVQEPHPRLLSRGEKSVTQCGILSKHKWLFVYLVLAKSLFFCFLFFAFFCFVLFCFVFSNICLYFKKHTVILQCHVLLVNGILINISACWMWWFVS